MSQRNRIRQDSSSLSISVPDQSLIDDIFVAVKSGDVASLNRFITSNAKTASILAKHKDSMSGNMAIHYCAVQGYIEIVKLLLKCNADVNSRNDYGWTAIMMAVYHNNLAMVRLLASVNTINLNSCNEFGLGIFHIAIYQCNMPILRFFLDSGANINAVENTGNGMTPLMMACHVGKPALVTLLLHHGAECNTQQKSNGWTALMYAANSTVSSHIVRMLVEYGADPGVKTVTGQTALDIARKRGHSDVVASIIALFGPTNSSDAPAIFGGGGQPIVKHRIFNAISNDQQALVSKILREEPRAVYERDPDDGITPLMLASIKGDLETVRALIYARAHVNQRDDVEWTALKYAAYYNRPDVVDYLIRHGAHIKLDQSLQNDDTRIMNELTNLTSDLDLIKLLRAAITFMEDPLMDVSNNTTEHVIDNESPSERSRRSSGGSEKPSGWFSKFLKKSKWKKSESDISQSGSSSKPELQRIPKMNTKTKNKSRPLEDDTLEPMMTNSQPSSISKAWTAMDPSRRGLPDSTSQTSMSTSSDPGGFPANFGMTAMSVATSKINTDSKSIELSLRAGSVGPEEKKVVITDIKQYTPFDMIMGSDPSAVIIPPNDDAQSFGHLRTYSSGRKYTVHTRDRSDMSFVNHGSAGDSSSEAIEQTAILTSRAAEAGDLNTFLHILDLTQYLNPFQVQGIETIGDLSSLTDFDLQRLGVETQNHRQLLILSCQSWKAEQQVKQVMSVQDAVRDFMSIPTVSSTYSYRRGSVRNPKDGSIDDDHSAINTNQSYTLQRSELGSINSPIPNFTVGYDSMLSKSQSSQMVKNFQSAAANTAPATYYRSNVRSAVPTTASSRQARAPTDKHEMIAEMKKKKADSKGLNLSHSNGSISSQLLQDARSRTPPAM